MFRRRMNWIARHGNAPTQTTQRKNAHLTYAQRRTTTPATASKLTCGLVTERRC